MARARFGAGCGNVRNLCCLRPQSECAANKWPPRACGDHATVARWLWHNVGPTPRVRGPPAPTSSVSPTESGVLGVSLLVKGWRCTGWRSCGAAHSGCIRHVHAVPVRATHQRYPSPGPRMSATTQPNDAAGSGRIPSLVDLLPAPADCPVRSELSNARSATHHRFG